MGARRLDPETAKEGAALVSSAIAESLEGAHDLAIVFQTARPAELAGLAGVLRSVTSDISALTDALSVFARWSDTAAPHLEKLGGATPTGDNAA